MEVASKVVIYELHDNYSSLLGVVTEGWNTWVCIFSLICKSRLNWHIHGCRRYCSNFFVLKVLTYQNLSLKLCQKRWIVFECEVVCLAKKNSEYADILSPVFFSKSTDCIQNRSLAVFLCPFIQVFVRNIFNDGNVVVSKIIS